MKNQRRPSSLEFETKFKCIGGIKGIENYRAREVD